MAKVALPRYFRSKRLSDRTTAYYWERPTWAKPPAERYGRRCPVDSEALGTDLATAIAKAELLNASFEEWRLGVDGKPAEGTVKALFAWYRGHDRYKELSAKSLRDYLHYMPIIEGFPLKSTTFGARRAAEIEARHADAIYRALVKQRGKRAGAYCMQICRRVWNEAIRAKKLPVKSVNPFAKMNIKMKAEKGNRETSRAEYDLFRETAHKMGHPSMALAAAISFEMVRRVSDVFGYTYGAREDEAGGVFWEDYRPGESFAFTQAKTGKKQVIPLRGDPDPESEDPEERARGPLLYPVLEEELAGVDRGEGQIVVRDDTGRRYDEYGSIRLFNKIRDAAELPKDMTLTGFRHGGATELGDAGVEDIRPISGHDTLGQTRTYNKANATKAKAAGAKRLAHVRRGTHTGS